MQSTIGITTRNAGDVLETVTLLFPTKGSAVLAEVSIFAEGRCQSRQVHSRKT
ncbi:hypothetical protein JNB88_28950 [Rhizobium cauense]|uniref:hypothetical protein n=1 Tax=Rhizobium cauense TaxID=1166683 RepID=UPI001C6EA040|nr:hypothetical protein [Rhizobium cauense]MBW9117654.1 hypothetical protein [Rhizobium cauense]